MTTTATSKRKASTLSPTMLTSLRNMADVPVGDWLQALRARKVHGQSTYALLDRGLIKNVRIVCTPDGCGCPGADGTGAPAPHLVITEVGRQALA